MTSTTKKTQILATMFTAYDKAGNEKQLAAYAMVLQDIPDQLLMKACHKLMLENKFLPAISEIVQACRSLVGETDESKRERTWAEAWKEIMNQVRKCGTWERPVFSTPEIEAAAKAFGWSDLCQLQKTELETASAQCRRFYEDECKSKNERAVNQFVLKNISGAELIGLPPESRVAQLDERRKT